MAAVVSIQRFSVDDGPGIRTTVFIKGCQLSCLWCHNPESISSAVQISYDERRCIGCGACVDACPVGCHTLIHRHIYLRNNCKSCGKCTESCPSGALELCGRELSAEAVAEIVLRDRAYYGDCGGLTISGGEPLLQPEFTFELAKAVKKEKISVMIETGGFCSQKAFEMLMPFCDRFLFDIKALPSDYPAFTGGDFDVIERNLAFIAQFSSNITLRCPLVGGCNDSEQFIEFLSVLARRYQINSLDFMLYHKSGLSKCELFGISGQQEFYTPNEKFVTESAELLRKKNNMSVSIKGQFEAQ